MNEINKNIAVSVVVPILNEEGNLKTLCGELTKTLEGLGQAYEIIFVDDGSTDKSVEILKNQKKENPNIKIIMFSRNFGQHQAIMAGLKHCSGEKVVTMDADLQTDSSEIHGFLKKLNEGFDVVSGWREVRDDSIFRKVSSKMVNKLFSKLSRVELKDYGCTLRAYRKEIIQKTIELGEPSIPLNALVTWMGVRIAEVKVSHSGRKSGKSKYGLLKLLRVNFDMVTGLSIEPIQIISLMGILISSLGFLTGGYLIFLRLFYGTDVWGARSLFALITIFFGILLLSLGIIGEYVARIYLEVRRRPQYLIKEVID